MNKTDWFYNKKWGIFTHYISKEVNADPLHAQGRQGTSWSNCVEEFDVDLFVNQIAEAGARYLIFTVMQGERYMCAPNATFDKITGSVPGEACSKRDLIMEIADALEKKGIDLLLYFTGDGPHLDPFSAHSFGYYDRTNQKVSVPFVEKWSEVAKEYSLRYGKKVKGWWVDGCYDYFGYTDEHFEIFSRALKAGNSESIVAFNHGIRHNAKERFHLYSKYDDYICGEENSFDIYPEEQFVCGKYQWHTLAHLGIPKDFFSWGKMAWDKPGSMYSTEEMENYINRVHELGGIVSVDVCILRNGMIDKAQISVLKHMNIK